MSFYTLWGDTRGSFNRNLKICSVSQLRMHQHQLGHNNMMFKIWQYQQNFGRTHCKVQKKVGVGAIEQIERQNLVQQLYSSTF